VSGRFARGLVVGKFCPLHRGHQLLIETALSRCDEVVVVSYTRPEFARCGPDERERWLAELYPMATRLVVDDERLRASCLARGLPVRGVPHNDAPDDEHREFVAWLCCAVLGTTVDAVFTSEHYGDGFAAFLGRYFGSHADTVGDVRHVCVDLPRNAVPVRGTDVRNDPHAHRDSLSPLVHADLVERIAILGGESSGKTTLAQALAQRFGTAWVPEYGRELWEQRDGHLRPGDMPAIGTRQVELERQLGRQARRWLFCDTTPMTTAFYSREMFGHVDPLLERLASRRYDRFVVCATDIAFTQDGTRRCARFRDRQHAFYLRELAERGWDFTLVAGSVDERVDEVASLLALS